MMLRNLTITLLFSLCCAAPLQAAELSVFAASSLTEVLTEIADTFAERRPGDRVLLNFAGSQTLATQIEQGAPADLLISANQAVMERLQADALVTEVQPLLGNRLAVATRPGLQPALTGLRDLARADLLLTIGNHQVPVGAYTQQLFDKLTENPAYGKDLVARIKKNIVSEEGRAKAIVAKLLLGEADAGIVYRSDIRSGQLLSIEVPEELNPLAIYPLAKVRDNPSTEQFYAYLLSSEAEEIFRRHRFLSRSEL